MPRRILTIIKDWRITFFMAVNLLIVLLAIFAVDGIRARHEAQANAMAAVANAENTRAAATRRIDQLTATLAEERNTLVGAQRVAFELEQQLRDNGIQPNVGNE